jgi:2-amino-4-hydroxy-6-hydroxymethyldihydropteridine diphosphokinase
MPKLGDEGSDVFVGIGTNLEPERNVRLAITALEARFGHLTCSPVYRSPAWGFSGPDFLNLVVTFETGLSAADVEAELSRIERAGGREPSPRTGSRTLDLDLLLYGQTVDASQRLPRDDVLRYPFVLCPLADLAPDLQHPVTGQTVAAAWDLMRSDATSIDKVTVPELP